MDQNNTLIVLQCNKTHLVSIWALCCKNVSLLVRMAWRLFLSISLAAAWTLLTKNVSGNQIMFALSVTAGTFCMEKINVFFKVCIDIDKCTYYIKNILAGGFEQLMEIIIQF